METMSLRQMILLHIKKMQDDFGGSFPPSLTRWKNPISTVGGHVYAYDVDWEALDDVDLLYLYEKLLIRYHAKMPMVVLKEEI